MLGIGQAAAEMVFRLIRHYINMMNAKTKIIDHQL